MRLLTIVALIAAWGMGADGRLIGALLFGMALGSMLARLEHRLGTWMKARRLS